MKQILDPQAAEIYIENFKQLGKAILTSRGCPFTLLEQHDCFLTSIAKNKISITAKYDGPEFKEEPTYYVDPKTLITKSKHYEKSYEEKEAEAIEEECRTTEKYCDEIDWTTCKKENSVDCIPVKRRLSKNDVATSVVRLSDYKVFTKNDYNQKFYRIDKESFLNEHYTFNEVQKFVDQGLFVVLNQVNDPEYHLSPKNNEWLKKKEKTQEELQKLVKHDPMWQKPLSTSNPMPNTTSP